MRQRWNEERVNALKSLWAGGATASAIAAQLGGMSRSAVLGKIFRLRLKAPRQSFLPARMPARAYGRSKQKPPPDGSATPQGWGKSLLELTNQCCRWPHGRPGTRNFFFCGAPGADVEAGRPYCPAHARRAYVANPGAAGAANQTKALAEAALPMAPARTYPWRAPVRHPAPRWR